MHSNIVCSDHNWRGTQLVRKSSCTTFRLCFGVSRERGSWNVDCPKSTWEVPSVVSFCNKWVIWAALKSHSALEKILQGCKVQAFFVQWGWGGDNVNVLFHHCQFNTLWHQSSYTTQYSISDVIVTMILSVCNINNASIKSSFFLQQSCFCNINQ